MKNLRTFEQVLKQDGDDTIYAVAALPEWKHYEPDNCPAPIREWILQHYPDVVIEQLDGFARQYVMSVDDDLTNRIWTDDLPSPIFRLGFDAAQAEHFDAAWSSPPLDTEDAPSDFYFAIFDPAETLRLLELADASTPSIPSESVAPT